MLLAIDTATHQASIALHDGVTLHGECTWTARNRHTVTLVPHIHTLLAETERTAEALTALAVCIGPGSYTGVRIGIAVAQGLALACHLPLYGAHTLDILVAAQPADPRPLYAIFSAGRRRIGYARYGWQEDRWVAETKVTLAEWDELRAALTEPALVVGELGRQGRAALAALGEQLEVPPAARHLRRAGFLAELAWSRLRAGEPGDPALIRPLYAQ